MGIAEWDPLLVCWPYFLATLSSLKSITSTSIKSQLPSCYWKSIITKSDPLSRQVMTLARVSWSPGQGGLLWHTFSSKYIFFVNWLKYLSCIISVLSEVCSTQKFSLSNLLIFNSFSNQIFSPVFGLSASFISLKFVCPGVNGELQSLGPGHIVGLWHCPWAWVVHGGIVGLANVSVGSVVWRCCWDA